LFLYLNHTNSDWDGNNEYEQERATYFAEYGYVAMAADIYGADKLNVEDFNERIQLAAMYRTNATLFVQRIDRAIKELKNLSQCDANNIALAGYCFGGTGTVLYAFADRVDVKVSLMMSDVLCE
jgi:dienelactone hydrolase